MSLRVVLGVHFMCLITMRILDTRMRLCVNSSVAIFTYVLDLSLFTCIKLFSFHTKVFSNFMG